MTDLANLSTVGKAVTITIVGCIALAVWLVCVRLTTFEPLAPACHVAPAVGSLAPPEVEPTATTCNTNEGE